MNENKSNMTPAVSYVSTNDAQITSENAEQVELIRNGFYPQHHADIQLTQGPTAMHTQGPPPSPVTQSQPLTQIPTTSISSPIAAILSKMQMNERNDIQKRGFSSFRNWLIIIMTTTRRRLLKQEVSIRFCLR